jgi:serine/threonine protein kinase
MPLNINALPSTLARHGAFRSAQPQELSHQESNDARDQLLTMRDHLKGKTGRITCKSLKKSGINDNEALTFKRRGLFNLWRGGVWSTQQKTQTNAYIKTTLENAYKHRLPEQQFNALQQELTTYLSKNHAGIGSRHFVKFIERFEQAIDRAPLDGAGLAQGNAVANSGRVALSVQKETVSQLGQRKVQKVFDESTKEYVGGVSGHEALNRNLAGVQALTGDANAHSLAGGMEANVYGAHRNGRDVVIRIPAAKSEVSLADLRSARSGDVAAAKKAVKHPMPHVAIPSSYVIKCTPPQGAAQTYEVSPQELPQLLRLVRDQQLEILATVMPRAQGQSLDKFTESVPVLNAQGQVAMKEQVELSEANAQKLSVGLALGMEELRKNKLVHHDIKPANVVFDPQGGVTLVDLGGIVRLSQNPQKPEHHQTTSRIGSPPLQSPWVAKGQPHSHEADRYSFAMTLLGALEPKILKSSEGSTEAVKAEEAADQVKQVAFEKLASLKRTLTNTSRTLESAQEDLEELQATLMNVIADDPNDPVAVQAAAKKKADIKKNIDKKREHILQLQADLASKAALENEAQQALDEATQRHDVAKAALTPVVFHKHSRLLFLLNGKGHPVRPSMILNTFVSELARFDPVAAQALETKLNANHQQLRKIIDGAFIASEPGENSHHQWAQVLELCVTATQIPHEQAALQQAIQDLNTEATRLTDTRVQAFQAALSASNEKNANAALENMMASVGPAYAIGVAEIVDALPAAHLVAADDRIFESEEEVVLEQVDEEGNVHAEALPKHLLFIPGRERLNKNAAELESDLKRTADASIGKPAVAADFNVAKDDPRIKQFEKDSLGSRAEPLVLSNRDDLSMLPIPERWSAFVGEIERLYPDPVAAENARRELPQLLNQGLSAQFVTPPDSPVAMDMDSRNIEIIGHDADGWLKIKVTGELHGLDTTARQQLIKLRKGAPAGQYAVQGFNYGKSHTTRQEFAFDLRYKPSNQALPLQAAENQDAAANPATGSIRVDKMMMGFKVSQRLA